MILVALLIAHFLADFTLQPERLAKAKKKSERWLLLHCGIYAALMVLVCFVCVTPRNAILPAVVMFWLHFLIDKLKCFVEEKWLKKTGTFWAFLADQALHIAVIVLCWHLFDMENAANDLWRRAGEWAYFRTFLVYSLIFVIIWDPACIFVRMLFDDLSGSAAREAFADEPKAGRIIGKLERLIIAVLVLSNQLSGIGFVLTAKSIARFKQFEDQGFAERYLVGTLASTTIAIIITLALQTML